MLLCCVSCSVRRLAVRDLHSDSRAQSTVCSCVLPLWLGKKEGCYGRINIQFFCRAGLRLRCERTRPAQWDRPLRGVRSCDWFVVFHEEKNFTYLYFCFQIKSWLLRCDGLRKNTFTAWWPTSFFFYLTWRFYPSNIKWHQGHRERKKKTQQLPYCFFQFGELRASFSYSVTLHCAKDNKSPSDLCELFNY